MKEQIFTEKMFCYKTSKKNSQLKELTNKYSEKSEKVVLMIVTKCLIQEVPVRTKRFPHCRQFRNARSKSVNTFDALVRWGACNGFELAKFSLKKQRVLK